MQEVRGGIIDVESLFKTSAELMDEAYGQILKYQNREFEPAHTGYEYLDEALLGGFYPQNAIAIGARPGVGKSFVAQKILRNVMDPTINPQAIDYMLVNCEFEMNPMDLLIRRINQETKKPIQRILAEKPNIEEKKIYERILKMEKRQNVIYIPKPITVEELEACIDYVMVSSKSRRLVIFKIDHLALIKRSGGDPKRTIDNAVAIMNNAKLRYPNIFFLIISQFNRDIEGRIKDPKEQPPRLSDFYQSDELGQLASLMVGLNNPRRMGLDKYMSFPANWYPKLDRFKWEGKRSFRTEGLIFHHVIKSRQINLEDLKMSIWPEIMPGAEGLYGEGSVKYVNVERPPEPPKPYKEMENEEDDELPW